jgi:signal transduction histidine kinase
MRKKAEQAKQEAIWLRKELEKERELLQLKERFISMVSHEFRTPLSVIVSSTELVCRFYERMTRERQVNHLKEVLHQADYMRGLIDEVLTVNKAQAGKLEFNPSSLNVTTFCQTTLERMQVIDDGKHSFVFVTEGDLSAAALDEKLLRHILHNLLSNAIKYSPDGGEVRLEVSRQDGDVLIKVSDQGIGIPSEALEHVYDPFYRAKNTGEIGGTGLGMSIVKQSVDLHGGTISCESQMDMGTTFWVRLPTSSSL